jgi:hypothetical protein
VNASIPPHNQRSPPLATNASANIDADEIRAAVTTAEAAHAANLGEFLMRRSARRTSTAEEFAQPAQIVAVHDGG